jgi:O-antigen/teichoic acid export membrane protein
VANPRVSQSLTSDYAIAILGRFISVASSALVTILTARLLSVADRGVFVLLSTLVTVLWTVGNFGIGPGSTFHAGRGTLENKVLRANALIAATVLGSLLAVVGSVVAAFWLPMFRGIAPHLMVIAVLSVPAFLGAQFLGAILLGAQDIRQYNLLLCAYSVSELMAVIVACFTVGTLTSVMVASLVAPVLWLVISVRATRHWRGGVERGQLVQAGREVLSYGIRNQLGSLVQLLNYRLDFFLVSAFLGPASLGIYSVAVLIGESLRQLSNSMALVLFPRVAALGANYVEQRRIVGTATRVALSITVLVGVAIAVTTHYWLVPVFGAAYSAAIQVLLVLIPGMVLFTVTVILSSGLTGAGYPGRSSVITAVTLVVSLLLDLWLIPTIGITGAALSSSLAYSTSALLTVWMYVRISGARVTDVLVPKVADVHLVYNALRALVSRRAR